MPRKAKSTGLQLEPIKPTPKRTRKPKRELDVELLDNLEQAIKAIIDNIGRVKIGSFPEEYDAVGKPSKFVITIALPLDVGFCTKCQHLQPIRLMAGASLCRECKQ